MSKIKRRKKVVSLYQGNYGAELSDLWERVMAASRAEQAEAAESGASTSGDGERTGPPRRIGQAPETPALKESLRLAIEYDKLLTEAEETAEKVPVWAIAHDEWSHLNDEHPARDDIPADEEKGTERKIFERDKQRGVNVDTFPPLLLKASLVDPEAVIEGDTLAERLSNRIAEGEKILADLDLSRVNYVELETAAWNVNVTGDEIPKDFSLVSLLTEANVDDSKPPSDSE